MLENHYITYITFIYARAVVQSQVVYVILTIKSAENKSKLT